MNALFAEVHSGSMADLEIENQIREIDDQLIALVDEKALELELIENNKPTFKQLSEAQSKEDAILKELEELQNLWVVGNFIKEIEINLEMYEIESVALSLEKLNAKATALIDEQVKVLALEKMNTLKDEFTRTLVEIWGKLLDISDDAIVFNAEVDVQGTVINYQAFNDLVSERKLLNINVPRLIDDLLINKLVSNKYSLTLHDNEIRAVENLTQDVNSIIQSIVSVINFISQFPDSIRIVHYISTRFYDWLKSVVVENVELIHSNTEIQNDFLNLSEFLVSHGFKRDDLKTWIQYELNDLVTEYYLASHTDEIRIFFSGLDESIFNDLRTRTRTNKDDKVTAPISTPTTTSKPDAEAGEVNDEWDAWSDDDIDFNDDIPEVSNKKETDDDWDAWDDDEYEEEQPTSSKKKLVSKLSKGKSSTPTPTPVPQDPASTASDDDEKYQITSIPDSIIKIFQSFISQQSKIPTSNKSTTTESKLNELSTAYYMISLDFYKNKFLLYNDMQYVSSTLNISTLNTVAESLLTESVKAQESLIFKEYERLHDLNPSLDSTTTFNIIHNIDLEFVRFADDMRYLAAELRAMIISASIDALYQLVIDSIMGKISIGEDESEYLSIIISKFLHLSVVSDLRIPNFSKISHIQFILKGHMVDIMNSFYNAEFFDLSTLELISLIDKLFADSDLKRRNIQEIREIREAD